MDVEKWIQKHSYPIQAGAPESVILVSDLRALLEGKVLCDAEPVKFHCGNCHEGPLYKAEGDGGSSMYDSLRGVLDEALQQASSGKGS